MAIGKVGELTVTVKAGIDRKTAELCLKIVEMYCNENSMIVNAEYDIDGSHELSFIRQSYDNEPVGR